MSNTILLKRSATPNSVPSTGNLVPGELALNFADGNLFFKDAGNNVAILTSTQFVEVTGNVTGNYFIGNGSLLTGIDTSSIANGNSQVSVSENGNVSFTVSGVPNVVVVTDSEVIVDGNVDAENVNAESVTATGNIKLIGSGPDSDLKFVGFAAPNDIVENVIYKLPPSDDNFGKVLATDSENNLFWRNTGVNTLKVFTRDSETIPIIIEAVNELLQVFARDGVVVVPLN
jgi:hypothetical protein